MKKFTVPLLVTLLLVTFSSNLFSQAELAESTGVPYKAPNSVLYGSDVWINYQPLEDQRNACLSVAFNGWLYAAYSVDQGGDRKWMVMRSTDDGATWTLLREVLLSANWYVQALDIEVTGLTEPDLKVFVARALQNDVSSNSNLIVTQLDAVSGSTVISLHNDLITNDIFRDVAIASDYKFPAVGASPFSLAVLYSRYNASADTVRILTSSNGGTSFDGSQLVVSTGFYVRNISLSYGRSWNYFNGRYFAAWEARATSAVDLGQIFTAHTTTYFYDPFTAPFRLDNLLGATADFARNPSICTQFNDTDNDLLNLTEVVLFDRAYNGNLADFDIVGCYNKEAANTDNWFIFGMNAVASTSDIQPDLNYDPGYNNFLATYFDQTNQKLRYLVTWMNMPDPYNWYLIIDKYNDLNNLVNPYPKVEINPVYTQVAHIWTGEGGGGGIATFDAEYSSVGIKDPAAMNIAVAVSPNPAASNVTFRVDLTEESQLIIELYSLQGKQLMQIANGSYAPGTNSFMADVSSLPEGCYIYRVSAGKSTGTGRLIVTR